LKDTTNITNNIIKSNSHRKINIFNVKTTDINGKCSPEDIICANDKYIIFKYNYWSISAYDIKKKEVLYQYNVNFGTTRESEIIDNIIYFVSNVDPKIYKYSLCGKYIGTIEFEEEEEENWHIWKAIISEFEIIMLGVNVIKFYDLQGIMLAQQVINSDRIENFHVTSQYVYTITAEDVLNIYRRL
jgi:hypothetical protein